MTTTTGNSTTKIYEFKLTWGSSLHYHTVRKMGKFHRATLHQWTMEGELPGETKGTT